MPDLKSKVLDACQFTLADANFMILRGFSNNLG